MSRITINSNISSLNAQRSMTTATKKVQDVYTRLSSGLRINKASDDAAGLSISENLKADTRIKNQGIKNLNDGASLLNIADGALGELSNIMIRLNELAEQSANGTLGSKQRIALDQEAQSLSEEYNRIARTTEFNGRKLFDGDFGELSLVAGGGRESIISEDLGGRIGDGTFRNAVSNGVGHVFGLEILDINKDGFSDLIESDLIAGTINISFGNGDGTFKALISSRPGGGGQYLGFDYGDFNNDSKIDIVTTSQVDGRVSVILGNGDGSFSTSQSYLIGSSPQTDSVAVGDFNGDGILDFVTSDSNQYLNFFTGKGDGTFTQGRSLFGDNANAAQVRVADLNNDGKSDIVTSRYAANQVKVLIADQFGQFSNINNITLTNTTSTAGINFGDFNGDGNLDIATSSISAHGRVGILIGDGKGNYTETAAASGATTYNVDVSDFNGDGYDDLVTRNNNDIVVTLGNGNGSFKAGTTVLTSVSAITGLDIGDVNSDGVMDMVFEGYYDNRRYVSLGNGNSGVSALQSFSLRSQSEARESMSYLRNTLERIGQQRGHIGAFQSRIETATNNLYQSSMTYQEATSRITDADIAEESSTLVAAQIVQQAATSILAQANAQPQIALRLLGGIR